MGRDYTQPWPDEDIYTTLLSYAAPAVVEAEGRGVYDDLVKFLKVFITWERTTDSKICNLASAWVAGCVVGLDRAQANKENV